MPTEEKVIRKLRAILSADVKGYSLLMANDEAYTVKKLETYRDSMSDLVQSHSGRVVDAVGDNLLAEFSSVVDAVRCSVEIQKDLQQKNADLPTDKRLEFRIGVNIGDVIQEGDRIYGNGVNVAARIEGLADAGGICISRNAYGQIRDKLELGYEYLGEHGVKNIKRPVRVYKVLIGPEDAGKLIGDEPKPAAKNWIWASILVAAVFLAVVGTLVYQKTVEPEFEPAKIDEMKYPLPEKPSIAVLPFRNMSGDPGQEYLADGISENIITALSQNPAIFVISRESSFTFKNNPKTIKEVSETLGVNYVLEGSVHKSGDKIRITAQFIDALKGHHVWAENYDRKFSDIFKLYDDIALNVLKGMHTEFNIKLDYNTENLEALLKLLKGRYYLYRYTKEDNIAARKLFEEALKSDPNYSDAICYIGFTHAIDVEHAWTEDRYSSIQKANQSALKAIELDDRNYLAYWLLSIYYSFIGDMDKAFIELKRAIEINPQQEKLYVRLASLERKRGNPDKSIALIEKALRMNPLTDEIGLFFELASGQFMIGQYDKSIESWEKWLINDKFKEYGFAGLTLCYLALDDIDKAKPNAVLLLEYDPAFSIKGFARNVFKMDKKEVDHLLQPIEDILYRDIGENLVYKYDGVPNFSFKYPSTYKEIDARIVPDQVAMFITDHGTYFGVLVKDMAEGMAIDRYFDDIYPDMMKGINLEYELKNSKNILLYDGTPALRLVVKTIQTDHRHFIENHCIVNKDRKLIILIHMQYPDNKNDYSWIIESLTFSNSDL